MQITQTTLQPRPAAQAAAVSIMRVRHIHMWCTASVAMCYSCITEYVQQQTDALVRRRTSLGNVTSPSRGDCFESDDDQNNPT